MSVKSDGNGTATGVAINDTLPTLANVGINWSISPAYTGPGTCSITGAAPSQTLSCAFGDLAAGATASVHVTSQTTAPANTTTVLDACTISTTTYATNLNNSVQVTSTNAASSIARTGICVTKEIVGNIHVVKTATPTSLPAGGGSVLYGYAVTNIGLPPLQTVTAVDNRCSPLVYLSGDTNNDAMLQVGEVWKFSCTTTIRVTTTNVVVATGFYDDPNFTSTQFGVTQGLRKVTDDDTAVVTVAAPSGSVQGATSPPKPHVTLPPTDAAAPLGSSNENNGMMMILVLLAGIVAAIPILVFGKRRNQGVRR